jgi:hypothetical protein
MSDEPNEAVNHRSAFARMGSSLTTCVGTLCEMAMSTAHVDGAAVGLLTPGCTARELLYATDAVVAGIDDIQATLGQGPCLDAYRRRTPTVRAAIGNQHSESPWPLFDDAVHPLGVRAVFAYPLLGGFAPPMGVLEMYRRTEGPLNSDDHEATTQCVKALSTQLADDWPRHVVAPMPPSPRTQVPIAAGMVALQLDLLIDEALDVLRAHSYSHGRPLTEVADDVVQRRMSFAGGWPTT